MLKKSTLFVTLALLGFTVIIGCNDVKKVGPHFKKGQIIQKKVTLKSNLLMMFPNSDNKSTEMILKIQVLDVDKEGNSQVQVTVDSIKADFLTLGRKFNFDSDVKLDDKPQSTNKTLAGQQEKFNAAFKDVKGQQYTAVINDQGKVIELKDFTPKLKSLACESAKPDMLGGDQVRMLFTENNLKEYVSPVLYNGVTPIEGEKQKTRAPGSIFVPYCPLVATTKIYTLDPKNTNPAGEIEAPFTIEMAEKQPTDSPYHTGSSFDVTYCNGEGKVFYSAKSQKIVRLQEKTTVGVRSSSAPPRTDKDGKERPKPKIEYIVDKLIEEL